MAIIRLYNTMSRSVEDFKPIKSPQVGIYACGPTVYFYAHIGNLRAYVCEDVLVRLLKHEGYVVKHVMNLTDVGHLVSDADVGEDKLRKEAASEHKSMQDIAAFYTDAFIKDIKRLNILQPDVLAKASDHIGEMLSMIQTLDGKGYLYKLEGQSSGMYYDTSKFKDYGALMGRSFAQLNDSQLAGARVERPEGLKHITDFAVWRFAAPEIKEMVWDSQYGRGFPGWHIECSAMSMKYLGNHFDIHCGGIDHIPIHHTNEIAQSEAVTGEKFVNYWFHVDFLIVNGEKMAKSKGNIYRLDDLLGKGYMALAYRYLLLTASYRSQINFTFQALDSAQNTLAGIYAFMQRLAKVSTKQTTNDKAVIELAEKARVDFFSKLCNDLNTPEALSVMHDLVSKTTQLLESNSIGVDAAMAVANVMSDFDKVLALDIEAYSKGLELPKQAEELIKQREDARAAKDYAKSDAIRKELEEKYGVIVEDTKSGPAWHFKSIKPEGAE